MSPVSGGCSGLNHGFQCSLRKGLILLVVGAHGLAAHGHLPPYRGDGDVQKRAGQSGGGGCGCRHRGDTA